MERPRSRFSSFTDFHGDLADAVRNGRREEFARMPEFAAAEREGRIPDPQDPATFQRSKLDWNDRALPECADWLHWYQRVLAARRACIVPLLDDIHRAAHTGIMGANALLASWDAGAGRRLTLAANLSDAPCRLPARARPRDLARRQRPG